MMMEALAPGGRCAVVVPEGLLFGSTKAHVDLRRKLMRDCDLLAVISLPAGVFKPYAGVKTGVLVFRRPLGDTKAAPKASKVWFYEVRNDGYDPDKSVGGGRPETPETNDIPALLREWKIYKESGFRNPPGVEGGRYFRPAAKSHAAGGCQPTRSPRAASTWPLAATSRRCQKMRQKKTLPN